MYVKRGVKMSIKVDDCKSNDFVSIRTAVPEDAEALVAIYGYYVQNTAISFEYDVPSTEEFRHRIEHTIKKYPYLVALEKGKAIGYAYAGPFHPRRACDHCCEVSIYVDKTRRKDGVGRKLYEELETRLKGQGLEISYALIALPQGEDQYADTCSRDFHAHMGYRQVGHFVSCGKKFGRYYDLIYMEKILA